MYQCHNQPRPTHSDTQLVQNGWIVLPGPVPVRQPKMKHIFFVMSTTCQYDRSATDKRCNDCKSQKEKPQ